MQKAKTVGEALKRLKAALPSSKLRACFEGPFNDRLGSIFWMGKKGKASGLRVIADVEPRKEGIWIHVSFSRRNRTPTYEDMTLIRKAFFPKDRVVAQVFPPTDEHVNVHQHCLHLWCRIDVDRWIPDLREDGTI